MIKKLLITVFVCLSFITLKYIEKEFENRHDALAYRESLGLQGIVEVYVKEVNE